MREPIICKKSCILTGNCWNHFQHIVSHENFKISSVKWSHIIPHKPHHFSSKILLLGGCDSIAGMVFSLLGTETRVRSLAFLYDFLSAARSDSWTQNQEEPLSTAGSTPPNIKQNLPLSMIVSSAHLSLASITSLSNNYNVYCGTHSSSITSGLPQSCSLTEQTWLRFQILNWIWTL